MRNFFLTDYISAKWLEVLFAALGAIVILWQMLLPGYVLTLDMVFGPHMSLPAFGGLSSVNFPVAFVLYLLHFVLVGWLLQKVLLFGIFFCLLYLPLRFYPFEDTYGEKYFAALLYTFNPFVYERLLAGQWGVLAGYALLFPFVATLIHWYRFSSSGLPPAAFSLRYDRAPYRAIAFPFVSSYQLNQLFEAYLYLLFIGMFSLHLMVMGVLVLVLFVAIFFVSLFLRRKRGRMGASLGPLLLSTCIFLLISSYWIVPTLLMGETPVGQFTGADQSAFATAGDSTIGTLGNVLAMYGFWGEHEHWSSYFIFPKTHYVSFLWLGLLLLLVGAGIASGLREKKWRTITIFLMFSCLCAFMFSVGVGDSVLYALNSWLFSHVPFWRGFRDSEKWTAIVLICYSLLGALGARYVAQKASWHYIALFALCTLPVLYTPTMAFGLNGQLVPVEYPSDWAAGNTVLASDPGCTAVFLPWHLYYAPQFVHLLVASPAPAYFDCKVFVSSDPEIGQLHADFSVAGDQQALASAVLATTTPDVAVEALRTRGIHYLIVSTPEIEDAFRTYPILTSGSLVHRFHSNTLDIFMLPRYP